MMKEIFGIIKESFGSLWKCRQRGESLEIITPFATTTDMYVSVFLTNRSGRWVVSDGGWMDNGVYCDPDSLNNEIPQKIIEAFLSDYDVCTTLSPRQTTYYYKTSDTVALIPNIVFDVANFISQTVNVAFASKNVVSREKRRHFGTKVKEYLTGALDPTNLNLSFNKKISDITFNVIVDSPDNGRSLINLVSGNFQGMKKGFADSNMKFDILDISNYDPNEIRNKIVLIDDSTVPIHSDALAPFVTLAEKKGRLALSWNNSMEELIKRVA